MSKNVSLGLYYDEFIEMRVKAGRYASASEVVREGLRLLEQKEVSDSERLTLLRRLIQAGFRSGEPIDGDDVFFELNTLENTCEGS
jgi:antitoxin ParD1/3/4